MDLKETTYEKVGGILLGLVVDKCPALLYKVMNVRVP
jgi:hypothetical protein